MAGTRNPAPDYGSGYRALLSSYRTRLFVAVIFVVAVVLGLVLVSLPRLLEDFFLGEEKTNLATRAESMARIIAGELAEVSEGGRRPIILPDDQSPGGSTAWTLGDTDRGTVFELQDIARADAQVELAPEPGFAPVWEVEAPYPEEAGGDGQNREPSLSASATAYVSDLWYSESAAPQREVTVTLSNPFTSR